MKYNITFCMYHMITGGIENILLHLIKELSCNDSYNITVCSLHRVTDKKFLDFFKEHKIQLVFVDTYLGAPRPKNFFKRKYQYFKRWRNCRRLKNILSNNQLLIDYFNGSFIDLIQNSNSKKIMFPHCSVETFLLNKESVIKKMLRTYDKIVCISNSFYVDMINRFPGYKDKFVHIYNPVDYDEIRWKSQETIDNTNHGKYFTSVARLSPDKDHGTLLRAFALFLKKEKYPDVKLYLLGEGELAQHFQSLAKSLKLDDYVVFLGNVENPYKYVKNAMANILSTFGEGLPTVLIEAQALNVLNIATNVQCGISEILLDGDAGVLVKPNDPQDLADKMSDIYHDKIDKGLMIKKAATALPRFNTYNVCQELDELFKHLLV